MSRFTNPSFAARTRKYWTARERAVYDGLTDVQITELWFKVREIYIDEMYAELADAPADLVAMLVFDLQTEKTTYAHLTEAEAVEWCGKIPAFERREPNDRLIVFVALRDTGRPPSRSNVAALIWSATNLDYYEDDEDDDDDDDVYVNAPGGSA